MIIGPGHPARPLCVIIVLRGASFTPYLWLCCVIEWSSGRGPVACLGFFLFFVLFRVWQFLSILEETPYFLLFSYCIINVGDFRTRREGRQVWVMLGVREWFRGRLEHEVMIACIVLLFQGRGSFYGDWVECWRHILFTHQFATASFISASVILMWGPETHITGLAL